MTNKERYSLEVLGVYVERLLAFGVVSPTTEQRDEVCFGCAFILDDIKNKSKKSIDKLKRVRL